jgi:2-oxoglutarate ferredoxin oxidoreductase subunit alpha
MSKTLKNIDDVVIRFAGDSGDGMQLTGGRFTEATAIVGNDLSTLPDYPAEIRAPAGSLAGVSAFQIHFSSKTIHTPGDRVDVLVAMNPAALKVHCDELEHGGMLICNTASFTKRNLMYAGYESNPLEDGSLEDYFRLYAIDMSKFVSEACIDMNISPKTVERTKNLFALGLLFWIFDRQKETTKTWLRNKFAKRPELIEANIRALNAGYNYGETAEIFTIRYQVSKADLPPGKYRNIVGNYALSLGLVAAAEKSKLPLFFGGYPITPASDILHTLSALKHHNVKTFQAEDEIAGMTSIIGAAFAGNLSVTASSGPGIALKGEALGLAVIAELPMVIVNVQRGGPSTGLPTKTEQSDLFQALYGRNGEAPIPVITPSSPGNCFYTAYEACRIALKYMTPVIILTDGYLANGSEPWAIPNVDELMPIDVKFADTSDLVDGQFLPYMREKKTLARHWAIPGTKELEHRIGGLEKEDITGNVSHDPENHHHMVMIRQQKVNNIVQDIPPTEIFGKNSGELLILSWGGTKGYCRTSAEELQAKGKSVSHVHLRWVNPLPKDLGEILIRFKHVLIPEINLGQLIKVIRSDYLIDAKGLNLVRGKPIGKGRIIEKVNEMLGS